jgi:hypothetical protein
MRKTREILRLKWQQGRSHREIARASRSASGRRATWRSVRERPGVGSTWTAGLSLDTGVFANVFSKD